ncbi:MAG: protein-L-isoaspartate(D-aspartate) O-methyltransferase [Thermoanaerobaculia bacterium]
MLRSRAGVILILVLTSACAMEGVPDSRAPGGAETDPMARARFRMVTDQIVARDVSDSAVIEAMRTVPRHRFVPPSEAPSAYEDRPLPIGYGQTISQPYIVAYMTQALDLGPGDRVLEIGTGSGYQAAVLAEIVREVYTIEIVPELARQARDTLAQLGYDNVHVREGDGYRGWPEAAPFDGIIVTAAPRRIPAPLIDQLALNGRMVVPVGDWYQELVILTKTAEGVIEQRTIPVRFVPMTGEVAEEPSMP